MILLGLFFAIPLYLQVVQGFDAFETGLRLLPVSVTMFVTAVCGPALGRRASPKRIVQVGIGTLVVSTVWLLSTIDPEIDDASFGLAMALLGVGMGLLASQLGNVVQSSVGASARSEVGGLQYTAQNLGSSLGTALIGSVLIGALARAFTRYIGDDPRVSEAVEQQVGVALQSGISFVSTDQARAALESAGIPAAEIDALVENYANAQLMGLRIALLAAAAIALASYRFTRALPTEPLSGQEPVTDVEPTGAEVPVARAATDADEPVALAADPPEEP
jgi:hypothetical protein